MEHLYIIYSQAKELLIGHGALLAYLQPEYLMPYADYMIFIKKSCNTFQTNTSNTEKLTEDQFNQMTKQVWLDLLLQTYKIFVHQRPIPDADIEYEISSKFCIRLQIIFSWLETLHKKVMNSLWASRDYCKFLKPVRLNVITTDFKDSFVLAAVTYNYCPYLKEYFTCFHFDDTIELLYYNATKLITAWKMLNITFDIKANDIIEPNIIQMTMLLNYLHEFLPRLEINETLELSSNLAEQAEREMVIENLELYTIKYTIKFFKDTYNCFSVSDYEIVIPPHQTMRVTVIYYAKKMETQRAYMYICGESPKYHYAKSKVICLIGVPDLSNHFGELTIKIPIYKRADFHLQVISPYKQECVYKMYFSYKLPTSETANTNVWLNLKPAMYPERINLLDPELKADQKGVAKLHFYTLAFTPFLRSYTIYFKNETVGDFCYKLVTIVKKNTNLESLYVNISEAFTLHRCICQKENIKEECPKLLKIMIPSRNKFLFESFMNIFVTYLGNPENPFWTTYASNISSQLKRPF